MIYGIGSPTSRVGRFELPIIGSLLGHATPTTTARYAHLVDEALRDATEKAAHVITSASRPKLVRVK